MTLAWLSVSLVALRLLLYLCFHKIYGGKNLFHEKIEFVLYQSYVEPFASNKAF